MPSSWPEHGQEQHADDRDRYLGPAVGQVRAERAGELRADDGTAEEPDQREDADDGPVAEAGEPVAERGQDDQPVEQVHCLVTISVPTWPWVTWMLQMNR